jgi:hypothetical protein
MLARTPPWRAGRVKVGLFVGASQPEKRPDAAFFAALSRELIRRGLTPVLLGGPAEVELGAAVAHLVKAPIANLCGRLGLGALAVLGQELALLVTPDTGPMHLAAWTGWRVLNLSIGPVNAWETGPYQPGHYVLTPRLSCRGCWVCAAGVPACQGLFDPARVAYVAARLARGEDKRLVGARLPGCRLWRSDRDARGLYRLFPLDQPDSPETREALGALWKGVFGWLFGAWDAAPARNAVAGLVREQPRLAASLGRGLAVLGAALSQGARDGDVPDVAFMNRFAPHVRPWPALSNAYSKTVTALAPLGYAACLCSNRWPLLAPGADHPEKNASLRAGRFCSLADIVHLFELERVLIGLHARRPGMQILPLLQSSSGTTAQSGQTTGTQATSFAALLDKYAASGTSGTTTRSSASSSTIGNPLEAANTPNGADLANLKLTKEDIAALRDELLSRGFTTGEIDDMEAGVEGGSGMTWGQMMAKVQKKVASGNSQDQHEIPTGEQAPQLGFFGKLGVTADESQQLVDSLAKGETESVWNAVNAKVSGLSSDSTVSLNAAEMASLARNLTLSDSAQSRISALFEQSNASEGLSGEGLRTAMSLVQNELSTKTAQEIQSLSDFRQAASTVLPSAWEKSSSKERSDIHEDDVARKAAQAVAMSAASQDGDVATNEAGQPASQAKLTLLADVPAAGSQTSGHTAQTEASQASAQSPTQTLAQTAGSASPSQALSGTVQVQVSAGQAQNAAPQLSVTAPQVQVLAAQEQATVSAPWRGPSSATRQPFGTGERPRPPVHRHAGTRPFAGSTRADASATNVKWAPAVPSSTEKDGNGVGVPASGSPKAPSTWGPRRTRRRPPRTGKGTRKAVSIFRTRDARRPTGPRCPAPRRRPLFP